jgi:cytoskeleton protein RodZ
MSSFGETLRREREVRGINLREVAEATKISVRFLQALENDRIDILPGGIFPRAFVRQYAAYLGLDPEKTVADFIHAAGEPPPAVPREVPLERARPLPLWLVAGGLVVLVLALLAWRQLRTSAAGPPAVQVESPSAAAPPPSSFPEDRVFPPPSVTPPAVVASGEGLVLDLTANQACWVAVQVDGVRIIDRVLAQGETQRLSAKREIVLSVGNAGGVAFRVNGRPGVALGKEGEVRRNILITHQSLPSLVEGAPAAPRS